MAPIGGGGDSTTDIVTTGGTVGQADKSQNNGDSAGNINNTKWIMGSVIGVAAMVCVTVLLAIKMKGKREQSNPNNTSTIVAGSSNGGAGGSDNNNNNNGSRNDSHNNVANRSVVGHLVTDRASLSAIRGVIEESQTSPPFARVVSAHEKHDEDEYKRPATGMSLFGGMYREADHRLRFKDQFRDVEPAARNSRSATTDTTTSATTTYTPVATPLNQEGTPFSMD